MLQAAQASEPSAQASELAAQASEPVLVYGGCEIHSKRLGVSDTLQPQVPADVFALLLAGEVLPPQATSLRREAFFQAGCFDRLFPTAEDVDLIRCVAFLGTSAGTAHVCASVRAEHQTTTTHWARQDEFAHAGLEKSLRMRDTLPRLLVSPQGRPCWRGRRARQCIAAAWRMWASGRRAAALARLSGAARLGQAQAGHAAFLRGLRRQSAA